MNRRFLEAIPSKLKKRAYLSAIVCGLLATSSGCNIPGLRRAQPGAAIPTAYNWNNGAPFWRSKTMASADAAESHTAESDGKVHSLDVGELQTERWDGNASEPVVPNEVDVATFDKQKDPSSFGNFVRATSFLDPVAQDDEKNPAIDDQIKEIEAELGDDADREPLGDGFDEGRDEKEQSYRSDVTESASDLSGNGLIDTEIGPSDNSIGIVGFENSSQLPQAVFYNDPYLLSLITETITGNQELKILSEEVRIACNETYARSGEYRPFVTLGAGAGFEKTGRHTRSGAVEHQLEVAPGKEFPDPLGDFGVGANVSWEIDIWNKLRNAQRAAGMRYLATQEGRNYIVTRVVAEVAENYYKLLALDSRLQTLQATVEIQQQSLKVAQSKKDAGRGTELAVQRFKAEVQKNVSERSLIAQEIVEVENRINFLAGRYPQPVGRISAEFVDLNLTTLGAGVPSELLQNRADIREAERQVAAAGLDVQVARARFYPSLSLTAGLGWNAFATGYLFRTPESLIYGMAGELVGPLINKRAIRADYSSANASQLQAIYNYQQTVLEAHIEVVNQITKVENYRQSIEVKKKQLESLQASVDAANKLFQNARAEYVEVLLAQREMMEAKMVLIDTKQEQLAAIVNAYQALGGGGF
ncbi:TolC family protein [Rubripirellula reticaptiva]|nr:TolC family protein [Rubripirellula reticaptiva]